MDSAVFYMYNIMLCVVAFMRYYTDNYFDIKIFDFYLQWTNMFNILL